MFLNTYYAQTFCSLLEFWPGNTTQHAKLNISAYYKSSMLNHRIYLYLDRAVQDRKRKNNPVCVCR